MKAKVIKTGEIVNIVRDIDGGFIEVAFNLNRNQRRWRPTELDLDYEYWQSFRRVAAKDILCSLLGRVERIYTCIKSNGTRVTDHRDFIRIAIEDADELIKQLRP